MSQVSPDGSLEILPSARADAEALREVYAQGVEEVASPGGPMTYLSDTLTHFLEIFALWLDKRMGFFDWLRSDLVIWGLRALVVALGLTLVSTLLRWLWLRRPAPTSGDGSVDPAPTKTAADDAPADRVGELRRRLRGGDVAGALEALWWWLAEALETPRADPSWTSRELLVHAGRPDLRRDLRRFDRLAYGLGEPTVDEVRDLWERLQPRVGHERTTEIGDGE